MYAVVFGFTKMLHHPIAFLSPVLPCLCSLRLYACRYLRQALELVPQLTLRQIILLSCLILSCVRVSCCCEKGE